MFTLQRRFVFLGFHRIIELKNGLFSSGYEPTIAITNKKVRCQTILKTKPSTSRNLDRLTSAKVPHEKFLRRGLRMSDYQASSKPWKLFCFSQKCATKQSCYSEYQKKNLVLSDASELTQTLVRDILMLISIS